MDPLDAYDGTHPLRTVAHLYRPQRARLVGAAVVFAIKHSPVWLIPALTATVIDIVVQHRPLSELWLIAAVMAVVVLQNYPLSLLYIRTLSRAVRSVETTLRMALTRRLQELSIGYHRRTSAGVLQTKIVRDVENVVEASRTTFDSGMAAITTLAGALVLTGLKVPEFLPIFALTVPLAAWLVMAMRKRMAARNAQFRGEVESMSARVSEMAHLIPITRAHALEDREINRMDTTLGRVREAGLRLDLVNGRFGTIAWVILQLLSVACLVGAAWVAWTGTFDVTAGDVVMLSTYFVTLTGSVTQLMTLAPIIAKGLESIRSMGEVLEEYDVEENAGKPTLDHVDGTVEFHDVTFTYDDAAGPGETAAPAVDHLDLVARPGETVALVGSSGSGKSTVLNIVIGFLQPQHGRVTVDGHDMSAIDLRSYRKFLAVVPQESVLFEGSIRDNVTYGSDDLDDDAVRAALVDANAWDFVEEMGGLDAVIGQRGGRLSGGQRQRLAIARALVRDPRVLVLDEATSALDNTSERLVQQALGRLMHGRTTFVVAHRLTTIQGADRIVVMEYGRVVEVGTHADLVAAGGTYARMHGASL
ncbi:ATP-binding cassette, subfamily B [Paraoerskovia marina]|uniref:ATP-binding cassette, subfamily B n=1 Tax=Paraoerskovia marina TaxID=545619 RepID=A0A1H1VTJ1_9CELL|nr:ABC transporter ATP-binding protein [Paraoerskovia marina]SDS88288.1 ATP-binding cassette, subfamily B [Paraoerskovia marina]